MSEKSDLALITFLRFWSERGIIQAFVTDVAYDGAMKGPNVDLYQQVIREIPGLRLIASGGVSSIDDLAALKNIGCHGVILGKAIYENKLTVDKLIEFQNAR